MQTVVSLLNEVDKFNNAVTVFTENGATTRARRVRGNGVRRTGRGLLRQ